MQAIDDKRLQQKAMSGQVDAEKLHELQERLGTQVHDPASHWRQQSSAPRLESHDFVKAVKSLEARAEALLGRKAQISEQVCPSSICMLPATTNTEIPRRARTGYRSAIPHDEYEEP